jgi:Sulfotransferase family
VADDVEQHRFVFIGGLPRSGTTLLAAEIARSTGVSNLEGIGPVADEGQYVQDVYSTQQQAGGIDRFAYASAMHLTEESPLVNVKSRTALWQAWAPFWDTTKPVLVEKTPSNLLKMRFLQALFPGSSFVVVVRHPIAEAMALRARGWSRRSVARLVDHWVHAHEVMAGDLPFVERVVVVRYEDLVTRPGDVLGALQAFLDIDRVTAGEKPRQDLNDRYLEEWRSGGLVTTLANRRTTSRYESRVGRYGYGFSSPLPTGTLAADLPTLAFPRS